jgi:hypothetical protein
MDPAIVSALAGTSGVIGLLALLAYFFYSYQVHKLKQSVRRTIEGESAGLFNAEKVVDILRSFETPESRLAALKQIIGVDDRAARRVYGKIEGSVNLEQWTDQDPKKRARTSLLIALFFVLMALIGLVYSAIAPKPPPSIPPPPSPSATVTPTPSAAASPTPTPPPDLDGKTFQRQLENLTMTFHQNGLTINGRMDSEFYLQEVSGRWNAGKNAFDVTMARRNKRFNHCVTIVHGLIVMIDKSHFDLRWNGSDGKCELHTDWQETTQWWEL